MFNSIFLMLSQGNKNKNLANTFKIVWILYSLFISFLSTNLWFFAINVIAFAVVTEIVRFASKYFPKLNFIFSIFSIMLYSFVVDSICYFSLPAYSGGKAFVEYVMGGFLFNCRFVFINTCAVLAVALIFKYCTYFKNYLKSQQLGTVQ